MKRPLSPVEHSPTKKCRIELESDPSDALDQTVVPYRHDHPELRESDSELEDAYDSSASNQEFSPIYRLNPDILARIFTFLADEWPTTYSRVAVDWHIERYVQLNWARVSHVCHFFRAVALDCAPLWSSLDLRSPNWTELQLRRCKEVDISVNIPGESVPDSNITGWTQHLLSSRLGQMRELRVDMWDDKSEQETVRYLCGPGVSAPKLESLVLSRSGITDREDEEDMTALFNDLLSGGSPRLQKLSLTFCTVPWSAPIFNNSITILEITSHFNPTPDDFGSFLDLLDALGRMPALNSLTLKTLFLKPIETESSALPFILQSRGLVKLPYLEVLDVHSEANSCGLLLMCIDFPPFVKAHINCRVDRFAPPTSSIIQDIFFPIQIFSSMHDTELIRTCFSLNESKSVYHIQRLEILLDATDPDRDGYCVRATPVLRLTDSSELHSNSVTWTIVFERNDSDLVDLLASMALEKLKSVTLDVDVSDDVFDSLAELPAIKSMTLCRKAGNAFLAYTRRIESMYESADSEEDDMTMGVGQEEASTLKFSKLRSLHFAHVPFTRYDEVNVPDDEEDQADEDQDEELDQGDEEDQDVDNEESNQDDAEDEYGVEEDCQVNEEDQDDAEEEDQENWEGQDDELEDQDDELEDQDDGLEDQDYEEGQDELPLEADIQELIHFLMRRWSTTSPIKKLSFCDCNNITPEMVRELSAFVRRIKCMDEAEEAGNDYGAGGEGEEEKEDPSVPNIVRPGQTISSTGHERRVGGKGANQAVAVHRAGLKSNQASGVDDNVKPATKKREHDVIFVGTVGYDGEWIKESMLGWGMNVDWIGVNKERATGRAIIQVDTKGENSIVLFPGANHTPIPPVTSLIHGRLLSLYREATHLLLQNEIPVDATVTALKAVKDSCVVVLNPSPLFNSDEVRLKIAWGRVDWLVVNKDEAAGLLESLNVGGTAEELRVLDTPDVLMKMHHTKTFENTGIVCTLGAEGVMVSVPRFVKESIRVNGDGNGRDGLVFVPAAKATVVTDTTGAGDCFAGYFVRGLMELGVGRREITKEQLDEVLKRAVQAAAICVEREGTIDSIPTREEDVDQVASERFEHQASRGSSAAPISLLPPRLSVFLLLCTLRYTMNQETPCPSLQQAIERSTQVWQDNLHSLFKLAKNLFPDVVWDVMEGSERMDEVWAHKGTWGPAQYLSIGSRPNRNPKAMIYARASSTLRSRHLEIQQGNAEKHRKGTSVPDSSVLRLNASTNPTLFANELEYLYTGKGLGEALEFSFDAADDAQNQFSANPDSSLHIDTLRKDLMFMWRSRLYTDVRIHIPYSSESSSSHTPGSALFSSHRFILASRCPWFHKSLVSPSAESSTETTEPALILLPSSPFTPASLHFTLGYLYTGTLIFSHRTWDLATAFDIMRAAMFLSLPELFDEIQARIVQEMLHGLFHAFVTFSDYEQLTAKKWGVGGCRCRMCARRVPRVLMFALEEDVKNQILERGARRAAVGHFGEGWATEEFASLPQELRKSILKGLRKRTIPLNIFPLLFAAERGLIRLDDKTESWADTSRDMILHARQFVDEVLAKECELCFESDDWMGFMDEDGGGFEDWEKVEWVMAAVLRGMKEDWAPTVYQTLVSSILLKPHPTNSAKPMLSGSSPIRALVEETRVEVLMWIRKRWLAIRDARGFDHLEAWALKEISDDLEVPFVDLLNTASSQNVEQEPAPVVPRVRRRLDSPPSIPSSPISPTASASLASKMHDDQTSVLSDAVTDIETSARSSLSRSSSSETLRGATGAAQVGTSSKEAGDTNRPLTPVVPSSPVTNIPAETPTFASPVPPSSLQFITGFLNTGTLIFSSKSYDLSTAFGIMRAASFLSLPKLYDEIQTCIIQDMLHGLFHAYIPCAEYTQKTGGRWDAEGCRCRQCARRVPRVLEFALAQDVASPQLERGSRRALVGHFGEGWTTEEFASLAPIHHESTLRSLEEYITPTNVFPLLFAAERALSRLSGIAASESWGDVSREMILRARKMIDGLLTKESERCFESEEWMDIMSRDGDRFEDEEKVQWTMAAVLRGVREPWGPTVYQTLASSTILKTYPIEDNISIYAATSYIRDQVRETCAELLKWIGEHWLVIRSAKGFENLEPWALEDISNAIEVPSSDLLI
ncbi:hypothetical protein CVT24_009603 [Panaeolus cyanescens]|uniref:Ribokinase n=1 Tax=Panaeolus cyanescens TaxID=181874 RepID=A0A409YA25_9AGAR|nr:hypothetical protein CVT24_009603 [Panaeolus cyanescens]